MSAPLISIVITTYNMQKYISRAINSVLMQDIRVPYEIIIADDYSTDDTLNIVNAYQKQYPNIIIINSEENKGLIHNFVKGLKHCNGQYIATLDADDYWIDEKKLQKQFDILEKQNHIGFVYTNFYYEYEGFGIRKKGIKDDHQPSADNEYIDNLINLWPQISTPLIRKKLLDFAELDQFVTLQFHAQDYPLFMSLSLKTKGFFLNNVTTVYNFRQGSMSRNHDIKKRIEIFYKTHAIGDYFIERNPIPKDIADKRDFDFKLKVLSASWHSRDFDYVHSFAKDILIKDFLQYAPFRTHVLLGSNNRLLYHLLKIWVLRKRKPGK